MRWKRRYQEEGDERLVKRFLFFPKSLNGREYRWLEFVTIRQVYFSAIFNQWWEDKEFIDKIP